MKILNLYAGIGGNRKLWEDVEVTAVEFNPEIAAIYQEYFPDDTVIVADAHEYLLAHYKEFDFILKVRLFLSYFIRIKYCYGCKSNVSRAQAPFLQERGWGEV